MKLAKFVKFRQEKFGGVLFETRAEKVFTLNPTAAAIVREIQRGGEESQVIVRLVDSFRGQRSSIEQESARFIADLKQRGLIENA